MLRLLGWLANPRVTAWASLSTLLFFAAEWVVSATWRGNYGYREDLLGPLGVAFCGPAGEWPCSRLYPVMNVGLVVTGVAVAVVAAGWIVQRVTDRGHAILLMVAGFGLAASGVVTNRVDYSWNLTAIVTFMTLGSVSVLFVALGSTAAMSVERRGVAVVAGVASLLGFLAFVGGHDIFGPGGAQRTAVYGVLVAVIALGTAGLRRPQTPGRHTAGSELVGNTR
ncbi:putative membrane protein [Mycolicibacterium iranicum]|uniref:Putative membrane protein n=1 Tax=Mycolicibacterium iranicum TaxID=912594 RepID=A0A839QD88_MYCIR|nr:hypothetical protein [Mycolicibacterium iranicum]MBB2990461.1 putative membrane protein [Mycolicibacterium iranicum]